MKVVVLSIWGALSDERSGLSFVPQPTTLPRAERERDRRESRRGVVIKFKWGEKNFFPLSGFDGSQTVPLRPSVEVSLRKGKLWESSRKGKDKVLGCELCCEQKTAGAIFAHDRN
jgi:hypothetical protein